MKPLSGSWFSSHYERILKLTFMLPTRKKGTSFTGFTVDLLMRTGKYGC